MQNFQRLAVLLSALTSLAVSLAVQVSTYGIPSYAATVSPPHIMTIVPDSVSPGSNNTQVIIVGSNFSLFDNTVRLTNANGAVTFLNPSSQSPTQIAFTIPSSYLATATTYDVDILMHTYTGSSVSSDNSLPFTVATANPHIVSISPNSSSYPNPGSVQPVTVVGYNFSGSVVRFDGTVVSTSSMGPESLSATIPVSMLTLGTHDVTVQNTTLLGSVPQLTGISNAVPFTVTSPTLLGCNAMNNGMCAPGGTFGSCTTQGAPCNSNSVPLIITSIDPSAAMPGTPGMAITIYGSGFTGDSIVYFDSTALPMPTIGVGISASTMLNVGIPGTLLTAGLHTITVRNSSATSNPLDFTVTSPFTPMPTPTDPMPTP